MRFTLAVPALLACGCATASSESSVDAVTVPLHVLANDIAHYRGHWIRTCGTDLNAVWGPGGETTHWHLTARDPASNFPYMRVGVAVATCGSDRPRLIDGCLIGRVARDDGSLEDPKSVIVTSHLTIQREWRLYPQCRS
jgi:hypothetical protein